MLPPFLLLLAATQLGALPIGFYRDGGGGSDYQELTSRSFRVYHHPATPDEAKAALAALEMARPIYQKWFGRKRSDVLPVIMSAETDAASFANFIFDDIELQTMGRMERELAWHELAHAMTYTHFKNFLGPAGAIIHLFWLPSWFLEGIAEAMSVSIGSDLQSGMERYAALTGDWMSYNSLHRLYSGAHSFRGYAVSGAFVAYILRRLQAGRFPSFCVISRIIPNYGSGRMPPCLLCGPCRSIALWKIT